MWMDKNPKTKIWVCRAGNAVLCAFSDEKDAYDWCEEANRNGTYKGVGICFAVEVYLNGKEGA